MGKKKAGCLSRRDTTPEATSVAAFDRQPTQAKLTQDSGEGAGTDTYLNLRQIRNLKYPLA